MADEEPVRIVLTPEQREAVLRLSGQNIRRHRAHPRRREKRRRPDQSPLAPLGSHRHSPPAVVHPAAGAEVTPVSRSVPVPGESQPDLNPPANPSAPLASPADPGDLRGQLLADRYQVGQKIGEGGMCFVYLARDTTTGEQVAIKKLLPKLVNDRTSMARLRREAALGAKLAHPTSATSSASVRRRLDSITS